MVLHIYVQKYICNHAWERVLQQLIVVVEEGKKMKRKVNGTTFNIQVFI
jgi:hypothetical protein